MTKHAEGQATIPTDPIMLIGLVYWIVKGGTTLSHGVLLSLAEKLGDFMGKVRNKNKNNPPSGTE
jgi:hypothetical protein